MVLSLEVTENTVTLCRSTIQENGSWVRLKSPTIHGFPLESIPSIVILPFAPRVKGAESSMVIVCGAMPKRTKTGWDVLADTSFAHLMAWRKVQLLPQFAVHVAIAPSPAVLTLNTLGKYVQFTRVRFGVGMSLLKTTDVF